MEKSKVLIKVLLIFRQSGDVLFFLYARRLRGYTATIASLFVNKDKIKLVPLCAHALIAGFHLVNTILKKPYGEVQEIKSFDMD